MGGGVILETLKVFIFISLGWFALLPPAQCQTLTIVAGNATPGPGYYGDGGPATLAGLSIPDDLAFDSKGNYYIGDAGSNTVRRVDIATGIITTYAGLYNPLGNPLSGDGGPATLAQMIYPSGLAFDSLDNLYIADYYDSVVRKVDAATRSEEHTSELQSLRHLV